jgi:hypothetical protein
MPPRRSARAQGTFSFTHYSFGGVGLSGTKSTITEAIYWPIDQPWIIDYDFGEIGGMNNWLGYLAQ